MPVWPVVSMPAKKSAAISGNMRSSDSCFPVLGSFALSSRSAKLPFCGGLDLMWSSSFHTMLCKALSRHARRIFLVSGPFEGLSGERHFCESLSVCELV